MKDWTGNKKSTYAAIGASNHSNQERQKDDFYATDPIAIDKLLMVEKPSKHIWECACGQGHLSERLKQHGYIVFSTDIRDRGYPETVLFDFLKAECPYNGFECDILTNPPYKYAKEFVLKALQLLRPGGNAYMFLKLTFLEGKKRYDDLFSKYPPKTVYVFIQRINCAMNGQFEKYHSSAVAYAWFVWQKGYTGTTEIKWI